MGRTQSPEFGILPVTEPRRFGAARNPWDPERTTGGSSGGSGGAVAAGAVPVGHASDGGGSIRIPAACNGLVGLKPSRGRISRAPDLGDHMLSTDGALTRTVADAAAVLDLLAGYETGRCHLGLAARGPVRRRWPRVSRASCASRSRFDLPVESDLDPQYEQAARDTAKLLEELGHHVEEVDAPWKGVDLLPTFSVLWAANVSVSATFCGMLGGERRRRDHGAAVHVAVRDGPLDHRAGLPPGRRPAAVVLARGGGLLRRLGRADHAVAGQAAGTPRRDRPDGREPGVRVQEVGRVHARTRPA